MSTRKPPFLNIYKLRTVSDSDLKPCFICYKSTNNVLITLKSISYDKIDFFYICKSHLSDTNFCQIRYLTDNIEDLALNKQLLLKIDSITKDQLKCKENIWKLKKSIEDSNSQIGKFVNYFTKKEADTKEKDTKDKEDTKENDKTKLIALEKNYENLTNQLKTLQKDNYKIQLDKTYYQLRLKKLFDMEKKLKQKQDLENPDYFPSVAHLPVPE